MTSAVLYTNSSARTSRGLRESSRSSLRKKHVESRAGWRNGDAMWACLKTKSCGHFKTVPIAVSCKSRNPAAPRLGDRDGSRKLCRERNRGKPEQHPEQEPQIRIQQEIFVGLHAAKGLREK